MKRGLLLKYPISKYFELPNTRCIALPNIKKQNTHNNRNILDYMVAKRALNKIICIFSIITFVRADVMVQALMLKFRPSTYIVCETLNHRP